MTWWELLLTAATGGAAVKLIDLFGQGRSRLWNEIGRLQTVTTKLEGEVKLLRDRRHYLEGIISLLRLQNQMQQREINELYIDAGKPLKYPDVDKMDTAVIEDAMNELKRNAHLLQALNELDIQGAAQSLQEKANEPGDDQPSPT